MNEHTRRTFLIGTGAAAAVGTAAAAGAVPATAASAPTSAPASAPDTPGPVVAYVSDADSGQVTVMRGDDEVVLTDHDLARRLTGQVR